MKKAYHKAVLLYHPDKIQATTANGEEDRVVFLKIQEAYNTLTNETKRRAYDSQLDFDDSIPTEKEIEKALKKGCAGFCALYDPVFRRNARFAAVKPVPTIGDENTSIEEVNEFYSYWVNFDSWRDFSMVEPEHNPDNASCREEKRFMVKENEKNSKKLKKAEMARITALVTGAMDHDPRLAAARNELKRKKEAAREAREEETRKRQEEEEKARKWAEESELAARELAKSSKADKDKLKKLQSKARNTMKKLLQKVNEQSESTSSDNTSNEYGPISEADFNFIRDHLDLEQLTCINDAFGGEIAIKNNELFLPTEGMSTLTRLLEEAKKQQMEALEEERRAKEASQRDQQLNANVTADRKKKGLDREWTKDELSMLAKGMAKYPPGRRQRWAEIAKYLNDQLKPVFKFGEDECMRAVHNVEAGGMAPPKAGSSVANGISTPPPPPSLGSPTVSPVSSATEWSQEQQRQLEDGLKKYPAAGMNADERWDKIAEGVPGKTAADCLARFNFLRKDVKSKRGGKA